MKLQWMKDILGDAYTDEMDAKVSAALGERFVARADFNEKTGKVKELETQVTQLNEGIRFRCCAFFLENRIKSKPLDTSRGFDDTTLKNFTTIFAIYS